MWIENKDKLTTSPSTELSPSTMRTREPILMGKKKNKITEQVILLNTDYVANKPTPAIAAKDAK